MKLVPTIVLAIATTAGGCVADARLRALAQTLAVSTRCGSSAVDVALVETRWPAAGEPSRRYRTNACGEISYFECRRFPARTENARRAGTTSCCRATTASAILDAHALSAFRCDG